jgi:AcrR family transcriptional regulator
MVAVAMPAEESAYARKTRERILAAAERRFKQYGYAKSTIVDIAADCAMSNANVYRFYRSKADLVDAIAGGLVIRCERVCREVASRPISAKMRLVEFMVELYQWKRREHQRNPRMHELLAVGTDEGRGFVTRHLNVLADLLAGIIVDGVNKGEFVVKDPPRLARIIQDATVKFIDPRLVARYCGENLETRVRDVMTTIVRSLDSRSGRHRHPVR